MPEAVYPLIAIAVILTVQGFTPSKLSPRILTQLQQPQTRKSLKLQQILTQDLGENQFEGKWMAINDTKPLGFFEQTQGLAQIAIYSWAINQTNQNLIIGTYGTMALRLLDPLYHNKKVIYLILKLKGFETQNSNNSWSGQQQISAFIFQDHVRVSNKSMYVSFNITNLANIVIDANQLKINISIQSLRQYEELPWVMLVPLVLMVVFIHMAKKADIPPQRLSLVTISIIINFLMYISLLEFYRGIQLQKWLIVNGILTFCVVVKFTQTFQFAIRPINTIKGYMMFYCLSLIYFIGLFNYYHSRLFILLQGLWLVPQIIHNLVLGFRPGFHPSFLAMILINQFYILYFKGYYDNVLRQSPQPFLCVLIVLLDIAQVLILYGQHKYGARFFIPKKLRSNYYNYIKQMDISNAELAEDCAICLLPLRSQPGDPEIMDKVESTETTIEMNKTISIMETPCGHKFHVSCLNHWMQHKLQCPLDKKVLPPIQ